ncbi:hypothetical protein DEO72_LG10g3075 [Vigna unguiculata]|uniref:Uncharacterized protein n=1 Tax=Vigna unguiculata TaxID=3917 RepID=A0A4D6NIU5_VIGUN|nr:hypothetical protein DEO72_LG10g3075 [Vigna unguiculata]
MEVVFWVWLVVLMVVLGVVHHDHHLQVDDFEKIEDGELLFGEFEKALVKDRMTLMKKILDNRRMVVSWLKCQIFMMDQHHNLIDAGRNCTRKGHVGIGCLMGCQTEGIDVQTFDRDP